MTRHAGRLPRKSTAPAATSAFLPSWGTGSTRSWSSASRNISLSFFALPAAEKTRYKAPPEVKGIRGYRGVGDESLSYSLGAAAPPDYKETFRVGRVDVPDDAYHRAHLDRYFAPDPWPERPAEFRAAWEAYYRAMEELAARLMRLFALGLDLPERFFDDKIDRHISHLQANSIPTRRCRRSWVSCAPAPIPTTDR